MHSVTEGEIRLVTRNTLVRFLHSTIVRNDGVGTYHDEMQEGQAASDGMLNGWCVVHVAHLANFMLVQTTKLILSERGGLLLVPPEDPEQWNARACLDLLTETLCYVSQPQHGAARDVAAALSESVNLVAGIDPSYKFSSYVFGALSKTMSTWTAADPCNH